MMGPGEVIIAIVAVGLPVLVLGYLFRRYFNYREKRLHAETTLAAEKAAQYAVGQAELEKRVQVLEKIITDGGLETAAQIEALRDKPLAIEESRR